MKFLTVHGMNINPPGFRGAQIQSTRAAVELGFLSHKAENSSSKDPRWYMVEFLVGQKIQPGCWPEGVDSGILDLVGQKQT